MSTDIRWSSSKSFVFAAAAAAIGLGNVWRFSYLAGQNGGGAFVLLYLACVIFLALPLLVAEIVLGRIGRSNPVAVMTDLAASSGRSSAWRLVGYLTLASGFFILTYYVVIVGWVLDYFVRAVQGDFYHITKSAAENNFLSLQFSHWQMLVTSSLVILSAFIIIAFGVKKGLERAVLFMFPVMLILMLLLLLYAMTTGHFMQGVKFLFCPEVAKITHKTVLEALGQAFFSLNIAMGVTVMFSAYLPDNVSISKCAIGVLVADTGFALLSGLIIFPIVFAHNMPPSEGPSLIFKTLPLAFGAMPMSTLIASLFFLMLFFAAFSSVISILEPTISWMMSHFDMGRKKTVCILGVICWILCLGTVGSFAAPKYFSWHGVSFFSAIDFTTAAVMLPLGGIFIAIFSGWCLPDKILVKQLGWDVTKKKYHFWRLVLRWVAPVVILFILLMSAGLV